MSAPALSPKIIKDLSAFFFEGFSDDDAAFYFNLPQPLIAAIRAGSVYGECRRGVIARKRYYVNKIVNGKRLHNGIVWFLERRFPREFAKPETQLGFASGPATHNTLVVSAELAEQIIARSRPIEDELTKLLKERDQRSLLTTANNQLTADADIADTPAIDAVSPIALEPTEQELVKDELIDVKASPSLARYVSKSARARERASLDGHLPRRDGDGHPPPVPARDSYPEKLSPSGENPEISDLSSNKLNISESIVKRKRGRPMKKR